MGLTLCRLSRRSWSLCERAWLKSQRGSANFRTFCIANRRGNGLSHSYRQRSAPDRTTSYRAATAPPGSRGDVEGRVVKVPQGTETDFSTIPWYGRILVRWSKVDVAGVVHDRLYETGAVGKSRADRIWRIVAQAGQHHANWFQAWVGWLAVASRWSYPSAGRPTVGGWRAWLRHRRVKVD